MEKLNAKNFHPLNDRLLVERVRNHQGIIILTELDEFDQVAKVLATGPKVRELKKGMLVSVPGVAQKYPDWESDEQAIITEADVAGILEVA
jgi:co-chaperonin GroES (HSP10)